MDLASARAHERRLLEERTRLSRIIEELETENAQLVALREQLDLTTDRLAEAERELEDARRLRRVHEGMLESLSWRLTRPLRWGIAVLRPLLRLRPDRG